jgi:hypothetical protein
MMPWEYNAAEYEEQSFAPIPAVRHRVRIADVEEQVSKNGNDMFKLTLDVSGYNSSIWYYLVFTPDNSKVVNQKLGSIFDSFGITPGDMNIEHWKGKVGAVKVKHEDYQGEPQARVSYFVGKKGQEELPPWNEPEKAASLPSVAPSGYTNVSIDVNDDDLPF